MTSNKKVLFWIQFALLLALEAIVCFTPLGSIPIGPVVATLAMVPVIITAILLGTKAGTAMGFIAGCFSFYYWVAVMPGNILSAAMFSPVYWMSISPVNWLAVIGTVINCFVARALVGLVAGLVFSALSRTRAKTLAYFVSGFAGSFFCTLVVMVSTYFLLGQAYAGLMNAPLTVLLGLIGTIIVTNGLLEAVIGGVVANAVCLPLKKYMKYNKGNTD